MKIWDDFFVNYPDDKYALVFEDDFLSPENGDLIIEQAVKFIEINYEDVDILNLHNICVKVENKFNNDQFTNGYGFNAHAYLISRHYIQSIITKCGKIPEPNGQHIDFEINLDVANKANKLLSTKIFFTNKETFTQIIDKSDNYISKCDELFRTDLQKTQKFGTFCSTLLKKYKIVDDNNIKSVACIIKNIIT
jgi:GR25 family glycosyltransferase involved in LPS biosynthesis